MMPLLVQSHDELVQIHNLNQKNLKQNLSDTEKQTEGFVTWLYSISLLEKMHDLAPSIIVKDGNHVAGYSLVTVKETSAFHPDLQHMIDMLQNVFYLDNALLSYDFYLMGQVCIDKPYRGKGLFKLLYDKHREVYSSVYRLLVTEISVSNRRSQIAHEKIGFKTIHQHKDALDEWNLVVWDWGR